MNEMPKELSQLIEAGNFNPAQVQVVDDGQIGNPNVVRPDVMQFLITASIASQAVKIRKYFDDKESKGWTQNFLIPVTTAITEIIPDTPGQTIYVVNDGPLPLAPSIVFVELNKRFASATPLNTGEDMFIDFETHKLKVFYIYTLVGVANARVLVKG